MKEWTYRVYQVGDTARTDVVSKSCLQMWVRWHISEVNRNTREYDVSGMCDKLQHNSM